MERTLYDEDHEAFRASVKEFLDRQVRPHLEEYQEAHALPREFWLEAGQQGLLGLEVPEEYGGTGAGDYRFNAVLTEELAKVNMALPSCLGIHADVVAPYLVDLTTDEQRKRWLPDFCTGELLTAIGMTEPSGGSDLAALKTTRGARRRRLGHQRLQDLHHQRLLRRPRGGRGAHRRRRRRRAGITLFGVETDAPGFSRGRKLDKVGQDESDTAELFFEDVRVTDDDVIGELDEGFIHMMDVAAAGAARRRRSPTSPTPARSSTRPSTTSRSARRSASRSAPSSTTSSCSPSWSPRSRSPRPSSTSASPPTPTASSPPSTRPRPSGGRPRCRTTCSTTASSCTAATAT